MKDELIKSIWPDSYVEESNLAQNVFALRKALGEEKSEHKYIVTMPGIGYRFVAPVEVAKTRDVKDSLVVSSIAVLPFRPLVEEGSDKFLGPGLTDALVTRLSSLKQIKVRPTIFVLKYRDDTSDVLSIGRDLNVDAFLDGRFQRDGDQIRVSVQLVRVEDGSTLWAAKFDESFTNLFAIQDSISEQVAQALTLELSSEERRQLRKSYTDNTDAFQLFIRGRYFWNQRTLESLKKAIHYAQQTIAVEPCYAPAYVGLADSYNLLAGHGGLSPKDTFPKAKAAAMRALEIDDSLAEAYASMGFINYRFEWDWNLSEQNFQRAIQLKPNYATARHWYGESLVCQGRFDESLAELKTALEVDPLCVPAVADFAQTLYFARRYDECIEKTHQALEIDQTFVRAFIFLGAALEQIERYEEAVTALTRAVDLSGNNHLALSGLGHLYARMGKKEAAREILDYLNHLSLSQYVSPYNLSIIYTGLHDTQQALSHLERAVLERDFWLVWIGVNPRFAPIQNEPRFVEVLRRVGLAFIEPQNHPADAKES
jgi:TolB-like protein